MRATLALLCLVACDATRHPIYFDPPPDLVSRPRDAAYAEDMSVPPDLARTPPDLGPRQCVFNNDCPGSDARCCGGFCRPWLDRRHCGAFRDPICGQDCTAIDDVPSMQCCPTNSVYRALCSDLRSDIYNCGACGVVCPVGTQWRCCDGTCRNVPC